METTKIHATPFSIMVDDVPVTILEVVKSELDPNNPWYHVVVQIIYKGIKSRVYSLDVRNTKDLVKKLKVEITKIKMLEYIYGKEELKRLIGER
jgi:hypothetical protein